MLYDNLGLFLFLAAHLIISYVSALKKESLNGGYPIPPESFKYQVIIYGLRNYSQIGNIICNGAIIGENLILTTSECLFDHIYLKELSFYIVAGTNDLRKVSDIEIPVHYIFVPDNGYPFNLNSIAILKLKTKLPLYFNSNLSELDVVSYLESFVGNLSVVAGYADQSIKIKENIFNQTEIIGGDLDFLLKFAYVRILEDSSCLANHPGVDIETKLCGVMIHDDYIPQKWEFNLNDLGSPLVVDNKVVGILNKKVDDIDEDVFGALYTKVSFYVPFIKMIQGRQDLLGLPSSAARILFNRPHLLASCSK